VKLRGIELQEPGSQNVIFKANMTGDTKDYLPSSYLHKKCWFGKPKLKTSFFTICFNLASIEVTGYNEK